MSKLGSSDNPLKVAIVGAGPSGFYAADALINSEYKVEVNVIEKLCAPYGLVRTGVAPDHPLIKKSIEKFAVMAEAEAFNYFGNVSVGTDITIEDLKETHHAVIITMGAETDRKLGIPGEDLKGSHTATEFVAWYNGHPEYREREFDLSHETAVIIGQGNVAADVARILAKTTDELKKTDISQHALDVLENSKIKDIYVVGRRGPAQGAMTSKELKEFGELWECDTFVDPEEAILNKSSADELSDRNGRAAKKIYELFSGYSEDKKPHKARQFPWTKPYVKPKKCHIQFLRSPIELKGKGKLETVVFEKNALSGEPFKQSARGTGELEKLEAGILFRSIGYRGVALDGVPFHDAWGVIPNDKGRITEDNENNVVVPQMYTAGWIKRGPSGIIGTNKACANETIAELMQDITKLDDKKERLGNKKIHEILDAKKIRYINFIEWEVIDKQEVENGKPKGKPREKFTYTDEMLALLT